MRSAILALVGVLGLATAAVTANAAIPSLPQQHSKIVHVSGCGMGGHLDRGGHCAHGYGYGGERGDHSANRLNREELGRINSGN